MLANGNPDSHSEENNLCHASQNMCTNACDEVGYNDFVELPDILFETDPVKLSLRRAAQEYMQIGFSLLPLLPMSKVNQGLL